MDPVIKKAEERLKWLNSEEEIQRRLYEAREHSRIEHNSLISEWRAVGKAEGEAAALAAIAIRLLKKKQTPEQISELTGLSLEEIERIQGE